jgi:hypothetical protein
MSDYAWFDAGDGRQVYRRVRREKPARSDLPAPMVICDAMDPVQSMASGKMYDSKSAIRAEYKALGFIEVGNDPARFKPKQKAKPDRKAIRDAVHKADARWRNGERPSPA